jgi:hypothetical protein
MSMLPNGQREWSFLGAGVVIGGGTVLIAQKGLKAFRAKFQETADKKKVRAG